jgi:hypothetical protein
MLANKRTSVVVNFTSATRCQTFQTRNVAGLLYLLITP